MKHRFIGKATKRRNKQPEYIFQKSIAAYFSSIFRDGVFWTSIEVSNHDGSALGAQRQAADRLKGVKAGTPDMIIQWQGKTLWLELKAGTNDLTDNQKEIHRQINASGNPVYEVRTKEQIQALIKQYNIPNSEIVYV